MRAYLMVVDDDEDFADAVAVCLRDAGHEVQVELTPDAAWASMQLRHPDLVVLDVMFPEDREAGFKLALRMRHESERLRAIPILILTAINARPPTLGFGRHDLDDAHLPVDDFLEKPMDFGVLRNKVSAILANASAC